MWASFKIAFSMYSKLPMPKTEWDKKNMKYALCFFPMVGVAIFLLILAWNYIAYKLQIGNILRSAVFVAIPILVSGGIHLDGFLDTMDALSSYQPIEKRLDILKDPHTGAFAIISSCTYFILCFGIWSEVNDNTIIIIAIGFVISRALSGLSIVSFHCAKSSGLVAMFSDAAEKNKVKYTMLLYILLAIILMMYINLQLGIVGIVAALIIFLYYKAMSIKSFGGITGDIAGYFLQLCELAIAFSVVIFEKLLL